MFPPGLGRGIPFETAIEMESFHAATARMLALVFVYTDERCSY